MSTFSEALAEASAAEAIMVAAGIMETVDITAGVTTAVDSGRASRSEFMAVTPTVTAIRTAAPAAITMRMAIGSPAATLPMDTVTAISFASPKPASAGMMELCAFSYWEPRVQ